MAVPLPHRHGDNRIADLMGAPLLEIDNLSVSFRTDAGKAVRVVENVSLEVRPGETVGLVGESGCGKSVTAMTIMRLNPTPPAQIDSGRILFEGKDLLEYGRSAMQRVRGDRIGMIFQEPMTSLNPTFTIGRQIAEVLRLHRKISAAEARNQTTELLSLVGIRAAARRFGQYPHELSGGLRQRAMIAIALACRPSLLIADEPTTALDVTIQAQILDLLARLKTELGMSMLMITHDLGVVAQVCQRVVVMYAGRVVEEADVGSLYSRPRHPYTAALLASSPRLGVKKSTLPTIAGMVPDPAKRAKGCQFADRCTRVLERCRIDTPVMNGGFACWNPVP